MDTPLSIHNATVTVQDGDNTRDILDNVTLEVHQGQCVGIAGESGSGKSTLLAVAGGLTTPTSGEIYINGDNIAQASKSQTAKVRRESIGFVFQAPQLNGALTAVENVMSVMYLDRILPMSKSAQRESRMRAVELLDMVGLKERADANISDLSGGQRSRVGIARSLMKKPGVLLVDEPTAALDSKRAQEVTDLIVDATHNLHIATLFVSHSPDLLHQLDIVMVMHDGVLSDEHARKDG